MARAFLTPHPDGSIEVPAEYFNSTMENLARAHGVKLLMSLGGEAEKADNWVSISEHPEFLKRFLDQLDQLLSAHHYDGVDIDWEPAPLTDAQGSAYTSLLRNLRARFPKIVITTALPAGEYWISHMSWPDVVACVDYINVMAYDYSGAWGGRAAFGSNLFPPGAYSPEPELSADEGIRNLIDHHKVPANKLLMGMTFWAYRFATDHIGDRFAADAPGWCTNITYAQTMQLLLSGNYKESWDKKAAMPYLQRRDGGGVVCYENAESITSKCEYAKKQGCAGVMIWHIGSDLDGARTPLMDALAQSMGSAPEPLPREAMELQIRDLEKRIEKPGKEPGPVTQQHNSAVRSEKELNDLYLKLGKQCGLLQDQQWQREAKQRAK